MIGNYTLAQNKQKHAASCCTQHGASFDSAYPSACSHGNLLFHSQNCQYLPYRGEHEAQKNFFPYPSNSGPT